MRSLSILALRALALATFVAGCSSSVGNPTPSYGSATSAPVQTAAVTFTITPGASTASAHVFRKPAYLSVATQSVSILPVVTGSVNQKTTIVNIGAGVAGCTGTGASLACSGTLSAPVGETSFTVTTYGASNAQGAVLSVGTITVDVKAAANATTISNATSVTLSGVPASFALAVSPRTITIGSSSTVTAVVTSYDAAGSIIVGPAQYATGIELETITPAQSNDPVLTAATASTSSVADCTVTLAAGTACHPVFFVSGPGLGTSLSYGGEFVPGTQISLAAESPGLATQSVTIPFATPAPGGNDCNGSPIVVCPGVISFANPLSSPIPLGVTESGVSSFTIADDSCFEQETATVNMEKMVTGDAFTVYPGSVAGSCTALVTDAAGHQTSLSIVLLAGTASPTPTPTVMPTSTPTPVPVGPITISPSNTIDFANSTAAPQTIAAAEAGVSSFTIDQAQCAGVAVVSPASGATFTVTPVASLTQGGSCTFDVVDPSGQLSPVEALVNGVSFTINSKR